MKSPFVQSLSKNFDFAFQLLAAGIEDCPDELWERDLWPHHASANPAPDGGLHASAPWFLTYHALFTLDYDLTAEFEPWQPPTPFDENVYAFPKRVFSRTELRAYLSYCQTRVQATLHELSEEAADRPLPTTHRAHGTTYAVILGAMPLHVVEHATQIRQFLAGAGISVQPMPGDRDYKLPTT